MQVEYRPIAEDEFAGWRIAVRRAFNEQVHPEDIRRLREERAEIDRLFGAFDGDELIGTGGIDSHLLTVPGAARVPTAGVAYITTAATHRRRGVLSGMMRRLLEQAQEREEPLAALWASESSIYSRFGFGPATMSESWKIDAARSAFQRMPAVPGRLRFVEHDESLKIMPGVWKAASGRPGSLDRTEGRWKYFFFDAERVRGGWSGMFHVVYEHGGSPEGYAVYRLRPASPGSDNLRMTVLESVSVTDAAHAALWRFLFDVDLVEEVTAHKRPPDDPVWWMLADPRRLERRPEDGLWLRLIDPVKALSARSYRSEGRIVIGLEDAFLPGAAGTYQLEASAGEASCKRASAGPDLTLSARDLASAYLGGARASVLARAGRAKEHTPGALRTFDRMFASDQQPWCAHEF